MADLLRPSTLREATSFKGGATALESIIRCPGGRAERLSTSPALVATTLSPPSKLLKNPPRSDGETKLLISRVRLNGIRIFLTRSYPMRGDDLQQDAMFSYLSPAQRVPADHPLRPIRRMVDEVLKGLSRRFETLYSKTGRPSVPLEKLLRALLLQVLYTVRSERLLLEQLDYNLLFRWFVGLNMDDPVWDATVFSKNRERLLKGEIAQAFF